MTHKAEQDKQTKCNRNSFLSIKETTMNGKTSTRIDTALPINNYLTLPMKPHGSRMFTPSCTVQAATNGRKRFWRGLCSKTQESERKQKDKTEKTQNVPS